MKLYRRYLIREVAAAILLVLVAFLALFGFFDLIAELKNVGQGGYQLQHAVLFVLLPPGPWTLYPFAAVMGLMWLGRVPLTNGVLSGVFGLRYLGTLFGLVFIGHQLGSFLGVWMGGRVFEATGSYVLVWLLAIALGVLAAALHWPIDDRPLLRSPAPAAA